MVFDVVPLFLDFFVVTEVFPFCPPCEPENLRLSAAEQLQPAKCGFSLEGKPQIETRLHRG